MKVLTRNVFFSVLKVGIITALLASLMLMGVDLFKNLDTYTSYLVDGSTVLKLTLLYFPEAFLLSIGAAFLFSVTYYLSMLHANNEIICVLNAGVSYVRVIIPILFTAVLISGFYFAFNEYVAIGCSNEKEALMQVITSTENGANDNSEIALSDMQSGYMVYADSYIDSNQTLYKVTLLEKDSSGNLVRRTNAYKAVWSQDDKSWTLYDVYVYRPSDDGLSTDIEYIEQYTDEVMKLEPQLFRNLSAEVSKMSLSLAHDYVKRMKTLNPEQYASLGTEYYERILSCLTPFVLMIIACSMNYRFKKNVLFFSILCSICVAVVYYVILMMTRMMANQGIIAPWWGTLIPFIAISLLSAVLAVLLRL